MLTGRADGFEHAAPAGRPVRATRAAPRPSTTVVENSPRLDRRCPTPTGWPRPSRCRGERPARRRRRRRRRADRRHGLGGAEQHRRGQDRPAGHRRQRQRPLLRADHRRPRRPPRDAAHAARATSRCSSGPQGAPAAARRSSARPSTTRCTAMKKGMKDVARAAGHVRGPRPEVRRPDRRPRRATPSSTRCAGPERFGGPVIVHAITRKGMRLRAGRERRGRPVPRRRRHRPRDRPAARRAGPRRGPTSSPTRWSRSAPSAATSSRITAAMLVPDRARPRSPRAFPDRIFDVGIAEQHAVTSAAGLAMGGLHPVVAIYATFLNRAFDQVLMDVALHKLPVSRSCSTGPASPATTAPATTACGTCRSSRSSRACGSPRRATAPSCASSCARRVDVDDGPTVVRFPKGAAADGHPGGRPRRRRRRAASRRGVAEDVLVVGVGAMAGRRARGRRPARRPRASASPSSTRAGSSPVDPALLDLAAAAPAGRRRSRTTAGSAAWARGWRRLLRDAGVPHAGARLRHPAALPRPRRAGPGAGRHRPHRAGHLPAVVEAAAGLTATQLEDWGTSPTG